MTINSYFTSLGISTTLAWTAFLLVILKLNPYGDYNIAFIFALFYLTLFIACTGTFTLGFTFFHSFRNNGLTLYSHLSTAFIQGLASALFIVLLLVLQSIGMLTFWYGIILAAAIFCVTFLLLSKHY